MNQIDGIARSKSYRQLTSLTLNDIQFSIYQLEVLLSPLSSPVYLYLRANENTSFDFLRHFLQWEHFLKDKLPRLERFHFHISTLVFRYSDLNSIDSILAAFRTQF